MTSEKFSEVVTEPGDAPVGPVRGAELVWLPSGMAYVMVWCDCIGEVHLHPVGALVRDPEQEGVLSWLAFPSL